jgi:hypothetical protein
MMPRQGQRKFLPLHADFICPECNGRLELSKTKQQKIKRTKVETTLKILATIFFTASAFTKEIKFLYGGIILSVFELVISRKPNQNLDLCEEPQKYKKAALTPK